MRLSDYIQGLRKGKEAHRLEKESMKDPFLADAIDGYNQVEGLSNCGYKFLPVLQRKEIPTLSFGVLPPVW